MGGLHQGHAALIRRAAAQEASVLVSVFVNPLQFGPTEDFERYPEPLKPIVVWPRRPALQLSGLRLSNHLPQWR